MWLCIQVTTGSCLQGYGTMWATCLNILYASYAFSCPDCCSCVLLQSGFDDLFNPSAVEQYTMTLLDHLDQVMEDGTRELRTHLQQRHEEALRSVRCTCVWVQQVLQCSLSGLPLCVLGLCAGDYKQLCDKDKTEL